jgi:Tlde1 domain
MAQEVNQPEKAGYEIDAFAWTYAQQTGELQQDGVHVATGYSGAGDGKNNPAMESVPNVGPIPQGDWTIVGPPVNTAGHGPYVLRLEPATDTPTFGRSGFLLHGDSRESPGNASQGCVIMPRPVREQVWKSGDHDLKVVADIAVRDPAGDEEQ